MSDEAANALATVFGVMALVMFVVGVIALYDLRTPHDPLRLASKQAPLPRASLRHMRSARLAFKRNLVNRRGP